MERDRGSIKLPCMSERNRARNLIESTAHFIAAKSTKAHDPRYPIAFEEYYFFLVEDRLRDAVTFAYQGDTTVVTHEYSVEINKTTLESTTLKFFYEHTRDEVRIRFTRGGAWDDTGPFPPNLPPFIIEPGPKPLLEYIYAGPLLQIEINALSELQERLGQLDRTICSIHPRQIKVTAVPESSISVANWPISKPLPAETPLPEPVLEPA